MTAPRRRAAIAPAAVLAALLSPVCPGCGAGGDPPLGPGFAAAELDPCRPTTASVDLGTALGGDLSLELLDACGRIVASCAPTERFAAGARTSVRGARGAVLVPGCALDATTASRLRALFRQPAAAPEVHELVLVGACLTPGCGGDAGPPPDAETDASPPDAAPVEDAATDGAPADGG